MKLKGKVAFITGASSGMGEAIALRFAREGAAVAVAASSDLAKGRRVVDAIQREGGRAWACVVDVRDRSAVEDALREASKALGPIDILVNSAGVYYPTPIGQTSEEAADRMIDVNLKGTFNVINAISSNMQKARQGKIINISSAAAEVGIRERSLYCATKAAIAHLTRTLARELAPFNVNCNAILPGNTATPMNENVRTDPAYAPELAAITALTPSGRTFLPPDEVANLAVFLASAESQAMHGSLVTIDEGISTGVG
jgi:NAD(P)-dependent dehydrogenase (short-subunit alcohol dehydrogenase family)